MARIRTIKPKFWDDTKIAKLSRDARLLYIGMWNFSDDLGVIVADTIWLKSKIFPYDNIQIQQFERWIEELLKPGFISPISHKGEVFYYLPNFSRHQVINRPNYEESFIEKASLTKLLGDSVNNHGTINEQSVQERKGKEGKGEERSTRAGAHEDEIEIVMPWQTQEFISAWDLWKKFKKEQFRFSYKKISEQAALKELTELANENEQLAIAIIQQSISKGWQGLFELKLQTKKNAHHQERTGDRPIVAAAREVLRRAAGENAE